MSETWTTRELPVLTSIVSAFEEDPNGSVSLLDLKNRTGLAQDELSRAMARLEVANPPFFDGTRIGELSYPVTVTTITERALKVTGQWPTPESAIQELIATLNRAADDEVDPVQKGKLKQVANTLGTTALQILIGWASGAIPHHDRSAAISIHDAGPALRSGPSLPGLWAAGRVDDLATQSNIDRSTVFKHPSEQNVRRRHPALDAKQQVERRSQESTIT